jgi:hypothetical protein
MAAKPPSRAKLPSNATTAHKPPAKKPSTIPGKASPTPAKKGPPLSKPKVPLPPAARPTTTITISSGGELPNSKAGACRYAIGPYSQCGGMNCSPATVPGLVMDDCLDQAWPGLCCPDSFECRRGSQYYWQCLPVAGSKG